MEMGKVLSLASLLIISFMTASTPVLAACSEFSYTPSPLPSVYTYVTFNLGPTEVGKNYLIEVDCSLFGGTNAWSPHFTASGDSVRYTFYKRDYECIFTSGVGLHNVTLWRLDQGGKKVLICTEQFEITQSPMTATTYYLCGSSDPNAPNYNPDYEDCNNCHEGSKPGTWTALGCLPNDPRDFVIWILGRAIGIGGGIAFLLMIFGGFQVLTSAGNPERLSSGKDIIGSALAGLLLIIFSLFILELIGVDILGLKNVGFKFGG
jgi:hypothetical protein